MEQATDVLADLDAYPADPQDDEVATYAAKIEKAEARLDFAQLAADVERRIRAFNPMPGAFFEYGGERVKIWEAAVIEGEGEHGVVIDDELTIACGLDAVRPTLVQRAGKGRITAQELLRGFPIPSGTPLG